MRKETKPSNNLWDRFQDNQQNESKDGGGGERHRLIETLNLSRF